LGKALHWAYYRGADAPAPAIEGVQVAPPVESIPPLQPELLNIVLKSGVVNGVGKWLPKAERLHVAHGVTVRSPFLDRNLINNAFEIPERYKIYRWREKHIFREAVKPLLPPAALNRPKFPQAMKYDRVFSDILDEICTEFLTPERVRSRGFFSVADIENLRRRPKNGLHSSERSMRLWTAILTELWAQLFIDGRGKKPE
jgi:asparagine synthase (glutamine-hydrolysing)